MELKDVKWWDRGAEEKCKKKKDKEQNYVSSLQQDEKKTPGEREWKEREQASELIKGLRCGDKAWVRQG